MCVRKNESQTLKAINYSVVRFSSQSFCPVSLQLYKARVRSLFCSGRPTPTFCIHIPPTVCRAQSICSRIVAVFLESCGAAPQTLAGIHRDSHESSPCRCSDTADTDVNFTQNYSILRQFVWTKPDTLTSSRVMNSEDVAMRRLVEDVGEPFFAGWLSRFVGAFRLDRGLEVVGNREVEWKLDEWECVSVSHLLAGRRAKRVAYAIELNFTELPSGGLRWWWSCPACRRRVDALLSAHGSGSACMPVVLRVGIWVPISMAESQSKEAPAVYHGRMRTKGVDGCVWVGDTIATDCEEVMAQNCYRNAVLPRSRSSEGPSNTKRPQANAPLAPAASRASLLSFNALRG